MAQAIHLPRPQPTFLFQSLTLAGCPSTAGRGRVTFLVSVSLHAALVAAIVIVPLLFYDAIPEPEGNVLKAFFAVPAEIPPAPPPPPPPPPAMRAAVKAPVPVPAAPPAQFVAPIETPSEIKAEAGLDIGLGVDGGVPGGVEGGVPGGVIGGIVGGVMSEAPPPVRVVRVGGLLKAPKLIKKVPPVYPELAVAARLSAIVILEAHVDVRGVVKDVQVLRSQALFNEAAIAAVKEWRYVPLLLNGEPTEFMVTVTISFNLTQAVG